MNRVITIFSATLLLSGCAEWQVAIKLADSIAIQQYDQAQTDLAAGLIQTRCRLPYTTVQQIAAKNPNFVISQAADCGTLPAATSLQPNSDSSPSVVTLSPTIYPQ